jgi:UDPglucose--hexose-1-phosphate uridylyltransferase
MELADNKWYLQYSPYGYYNEHCIVILKDHLPMKVKKEYIAALFEFVDMFPHYFIGANSDLPIVGGSILSHEHFQGGNYTLPLMKAKDKVVLSGRREDVTYSTLDWPVFCLTLRSKDKTVLLNEADEILQKWKTFSYEKADIYAKTSEEHNTVTTILTKTNDVYNLYLMPRNNKTSEAYPGGIFHVRPELQIIKNEGIGLIEAMGLFILPARLKRQLKSVEEIINNPSLREQIYNESPDIKDFDHIINDLLDKKHDSINDFLIKTGEAILEDVNVFKNKEYGEEAKQLFLKEIGL